MKFISLFFAFFKIGLFAFGGGYTIVALARSEFVSKRRWISDGELCDFLALSQTLPGIISVNFAAFLGNRQGGFIGSVFAVSGMVFPAVLAILLLAHLITEANNYPVLKSALAGVRIAVAVMLLTLTFSQARTVLKSRFGVLLAVSAFIWILFDLSPAVPLIIAGIAGWLFYRQKGKVFE